MYSVLICIPKIVLCHSYINGKVCIKQRHKYIEVSSLLMLSNLYMFGSCFLKLHCVLKNKETKENRENTFGSTVFFSSENTENTTNTKVREQ